MSRGIAKNPSVDQRRHRLPLNELREQTAFKLPHYLLKEFRAECRHAGVTMTSVVEEGIREWIDRQRRLG